MAREDRATIQAVDSWEGVSVNDNGDTGRRSYLVIMMFGCVYDCNFTVVQPPASSSESVPNLMCD